MNGNIVFDLGYKGLIVGFCQFFIVRRVELLGLVDVYYLVFSKVERVFEDYRKDILGYWVFFCIIFFCYFCDGVVDDIFVGIICSKLQFLVVEMYQYWCFYYIELNVFYIQFRVGVVKFVLLGVLLRKEQFDVYFLVFRKDGICFDFFLKFIFIKVQQFVIVNLREIQFGYYICFKVVFWFVILCLQVIEQINCYKG